MFGLALEDDLLHAIAGPGDRAHNLRGQRRSLGQAAQRIQAFLPQVFLIGGDGLGRLPLLIVHFPTHGRVLRLSEQVAVHHAGRRFPHLFRRHIQVSAAHRGNTEQQYNDR